MSQESGRVVSIVDDDASLRRSLRNLLMSVGLYVETFESAEVFLESRSRVNTGCLVLDLRMPGMGGAGLLKHVMASGSRIPVIILTAHGDDDTRQRSLHAGALLDMAGAMANERAANAELRERKAKRNG